MDADKPLRAKVPDTTTVFAAGAVLILGEHLTTSGHGFFPMEPGGAPNAQVPNVNTGKSDISWKDLWFPVDFPLSQPIGNGGFNGFTMV